MLSDTEKQTRITQRDKEVTELESNYYMEKVKRKAHHDYWFCAPPKKESINLP